MVLTVMPAADVRVGDVIEWGPVRRPVLDSFHSHASLNSMRTFVVCRILRCPDRRGRAFVVFHTHEKQLLEATHQAVLGEDGTASVVRTPPSGVLRESYPAFYLDGGESVGVHRAGQ